MLESYFSFDWQGRHDKHSMRTLSYSIMGALYTMHDKLLNIIRAVLDKLSVGKRAVEQEYSWTNLTLNSGWSRPFPILYGPFKLS